MADQYTQICSSTTACGLTRDFHFTFKWLTIFSQALKTYIRSRSLHVSEKSAVLLHLEELSEKKSPVSDIEAVELYEEALGEVLPESTETWERVIGHLRWQCVKAWPKNEDLSLNCFQACFSKGALDYARQVIYYHPWADWISNKWPLFYE